MAKAEEEGGGGRRAEWADGNAKTVAWVWWRRPEEWAGILADWVGFFSHAGECSYTDGDLG